MYAWYFLSCLQFLQATMYSWTLGNLTAWPSIWSHQCLESHPWTYFHKHDHFCKLILMANSFWCHQNCTKDTTANCSTWQHICSDMIIRKGTKAEWIFLLNLNFNGRSSMKTPMDPTFNPATDRNVSRAQNPVLQHWGLNSGCEMVLPEKPIDCRLPDVTVVLIGQILSCIWYSSTVQIGSKSPLGNALSWISNQLEKHRSSKKISWINGMKSDFHWDWLFAAM